MTGIPCPSCGFCALEFVEGYCADCWIDRQNALDLHNAAYDRWQRMPDVERDAEIKRAM